MDIQALITGVQPLIAAPLVSVAVTALEKAPVPFEGKTRASIAAALLAASAALRVTTAWLNGDLVNINADDVKIVIGVLVDALVAAGGYALLKANKPTV